MENFIKEFRRIMVVGMLFGCLHIIIAHYGQQYETTGMLVIGVLVGLLFSQDFKNDDA